MSKSGIITIATEDMDELLRVVDASTSEFTSHVLASHEYERERSTLTDDDIPRVDSIRGIDWFRDGFNHVRYISTEDAPEEAVLRALGVDQSGEEIKEIRKHIAAVPCSQPDELFTNPEDMYNDGDVIATVDMVYYCIGDTYDYAMEGTRYLPDPGRRDDLDADDLADIYPNILEDLPAHRFTLRVPASIHMKTEGEQRSILTDLVVNIIEDYGRGTVKNCKLADYNLSLRYSDDGEPFKPVIKG